MWSVSPVQRTERPRLAREMEPLLVLLSPTQLPAAGALGGYLAISAVDCGPGAAPLRPPETDGKWE